MRRVLPPLIALTVLLSAWHLRIQAHPDTLVPGPLAVAQAVAELISKGLLFKYAIASLFRVTWGYLLAALLALPLGVAIATHRRVEMAASPLIQILRPISPLAWIPISILWFGVGDGAAIFLIFLGSFFPLLLTSMAAVRNVDPIYWNAGRNFGLSQWQLITRIIFPAILPQLLVGLRITIGIAWLVVVAAEMIAVNSGLGFLIVDARNAGNRYDLVVAGMFMIGLIGVFLDWLMRRLEKVKSVRWGYSLEN